MDIINQNALQVYQTVSSDFLILFNILSYKTCFPNIVYIYISFRNRDMETGTILLLFMLASFLSISLCFIIANKRWEKMGYHQ